MIPCSAIVRTGANRLRRIVQNLVSNAVRYTLSGRAVIGCRRSGDALRIDVRVTGVGMGEKDTNTIFEEFRRLENSQTVGEQGGGALTRPIRPAALRALLTWAARQRGDIAGA